jgi:hypothetical protein
MKDLRKFYYWCAFITILLFSLLQWYFYLNPTTIEEDNKLLLSKIREREIKAVIKRKSINNYKRRAIFIVYDKDSIPIDYEWEEKISIGDSIIKPKGSLKLLIKRGGYLIDTLDYEDNNSIILPNNW